MPLNSYYFTNGKLLEKIGDVRVYQLKDYKYMENGHTNLISSDEDLSTYIWQLCKIPQGNVLIIGLGLGISANYILSIPKVNSVTVLESNKDIITCQKKVNKITDSKLTIINSDFFKYLYETSETYDFIYLDFYTLINKKTLPVIADVVIAAKAALTYNGRVAGMSDPTASEFFLNMFDDLFI